MRQRLRGRDHARATLVLASRLRSRIGAGALPRRREVAFVAPRVEPIDVALGAKLLVAQTYAERFGLGDSKPTATMATASRRRLWDGRWPTSRGVRSTVAGGSMLILYRRCTCGLAR